MTPPAPRPQASPTADQATAGGERRVTLAVVAGAHGIGGEVKLKLFTDDLSPYRSFNDGALTLKSLRGLIARFAEIPDRTAAEALRGTALTIPRSALPPLPNGEYYHADLIGLPCVTSDGVPLGEVAAVENFGAGDVIEIARPDGKTFMVPMRPEAVPDWNGERLVVDESFVS
jgi:16S rRNA processing protein RimM